MTQLDADTLRNKADTCRSLARHVTDERALRVLRELIVEHTTKNLIKPFLAPQKRVLRRSLC
jgi:hypothetical protein